MAGPIAVSNPVTITAPTPITNPATVPPSPPVLPNPPGIPKPCVPYQWPTSVNGAPVNFRTGGPQGIYLWYSGGYYVVRFYNPVPGPLVLTGSVNANATLNAGAGQYLERRTDVFRRGRRSATFRFVTDYDVDGFIIRASCATAITFRFAINGVPVGPQQIFVGASGANPAQIPVTFIR